MLSGLLLSLMSCGIHRGGRREAIPAKFSSDLPMCAISVTHPHTCTYAQAHTKCNNEKPFVGPDLKPDHPRCVFP